MSDTRVTRNGYGKAVLVLALDEAPSKYALNFACIWQYAESGAGRNDGGPDEGGKYNTLNTTLATTGVQLPNYNDVPVRNYATLHDGIQAVAETLRLGRYDALRAALKSGTVDQMVTAVIESGWGTESVLARVRDDFKVNPNLYRNIRVGPTPTSVARALKLASVKPPQPHTAPMLNLLKDANEERPFWNQPPVREWDGSSGARMVMDR